MAQHNNYIFVHFLNRCVCRIMHKLRKWTLYVFVTLILFILPATRLAEMASSERSEILIKS